MAYLGPILVTRVEKNLFFKTNPHVFFWFSQKNVFLVFLKETRFCSFFKENGKTPF